MVTVFLLSVGAALLTLFLAVFNYGRFLMAEKQTEQALASSLASVLSYYEPKLAKELGLFALDTQDMGLPDVGKAYFVDNLGAAGAINGQECLAYTLRFPAHGRLSESQLLADQAIDARRIEGWVDAGQDLLMALGVSDWQNLLSVSGMGLSFGAGASGEPGTGYGGAQAGYGESGGYGDAGYGSDSEGSEGGAEEKPEWMTKMEDNLYSDTGTRVRFWQFLSAHPPKGAFVDRGMPAGIGAAGYWQADDLMGGGALDAQADFWSDAFLSPSSVVKDETFLSKMTTQLSEFLSAIQGSLTGTLSKGRDKLLFTEYLLHELDFATNKPVMDRYFPRCEVEYVICGFDNAWDNLRNVALRIFLLRSSLHFLDSLMSSVEMNEAALVVALMEGVIKGSADVEKLFAGERVPSFPGVQGITLSYKDHLRLFLLCQS
ncbi:MAG: DUF5702 domain-containing protein, partial [Clostridiales bacterium]|nr:DUF5702 domain-containing protein [Clostridiales bacterium]